MQANEGDSLDHVET